MNEVANQSLSLPELLKIPLSDAAEKIGKCSRGQLDVLFSECAEEVGQREDEQRILAKTPSFDAIAATTVARLRCAGMLEQLKGVQNLLEWQRGCK